MKNRSHPDERQLHAVRLSPGSLADAIAQHGEEADFEFEPPRFDGVVKPVELADLLAQCDTTDPVCPLDDST